VLSVFAQHLEAAGITELHRIMPGHVREFYENAKNKAPRRSYGSTLRVFFRWAAAQGWLSSSLRDAVPRPRQYRYVSLPDVLGQAEVDRVLAAATDQLRSAGAIMQSLCWLLGTGCALVTFVN